ncbi:MAG: NUDIX hydrolase [Clostridia bacterium]|nr:NUDIX hydrolase [Clostridia bacterium]
MSGYIRGIRKYVGHRTVIQCGASVIVENRCGEILLQRRKDNGCWGYAGGSVEIDERVEDAAARELFEETGLIARKLELFGVFSGKEMHHVYPNGDEVSNVDVVYVCREYGGDLRANASEVTALQFFPLHGLPAGINPPNRIAIDAYAGARRDAP